MSAKQAINDKLLGSLATYLTGLRLLTTILRKVYCWVCEWKKIKSVNIRQSYMQERGCIVHFLCLFSSVLASAQSARDNQSLACNFAKYSPIKNIHSHTQQ